VVGFLFAVWIAGLFFRMFYLPELVGNVVMGIILGPEVAGERGGGKKKKKRPQGRKAKTSSAYPLLFAFFFLLLFSY
jgi:Kef-type K+ transport system membrane component KefB